MAETISYDVRGMTCSHCTAAVEREVSRVSGVQSVTADLERKLVRVTGFGLDEEALRAAIEEAGYEAER